jgi:hypothetical protein
MFKSFNLTKQNINKFQLFKKLSTFNFSRNRTQPNFTYIYPRDHVIVLPPFGSNKSLSLFERKLIRNNSKMKEMNKVQSGVVIRIMRSKGLAIVQGVNSKQVYTSPTRYITDLEAGKTEKIIRRIKFQPVLLSRLRLRDTNEKSLRPLRIVIRKNQDGKIERVAAETGEIVPKPNLSLSYSTRVGRKKVGPLDTDAQIVLDKTYTGEDFLVIARDFLNRIKEKKQIESLLFLKDK